MAQAEALEAPSAEPPHAAQRSPAGRALAVMARVPRSVRTKLLVAFLAIAALLVVVGVLGLRVLGQANARVGRLAPLQRPARTLSANESPRRRPAASARGPIGGRLEPRAVYGRQEAAR